MRDVDQAFVTAMNGKLNEGRGKGKTQWDNGGLKDIDPEDLLVLLKNEVEELEEAIRFREYMSPLNREQTNINVLKETADVANFAMMIADACGCLKEDTMSIAKGKTLGKEFDNAPKQFAQQIDEGFGQINATAGKG